MSGALSRDYVLYDLKGGSLRSPPAARLRALASLASSPAAHARATLALGLMENETLDAQRDQLAPLGSS